jgi:acyl-CoA thioesterase I
MASGDQVTEGVRTLNATGADVILMDLQYAPLVLASPQHSSMQAIIAEVARQEHVGLFPRFALMRRSGCRRPLSFNSVAGYDCVGRALARAIHAGGR